jgi:hypothetical protein
MGMPATPVSFGCACLVAATLWGMGRDHICHCSSQCSCTSCMCVSLVAGTSCITTLHYLGQCFKLLAAMISVYI